VLVSKAVCKVLRHVSGSLWDIPEGLRGFPESLRGFPLKLRGFPEGLRGFPLKLREFPEKLRGFPLKLRGFPESLRGFPEDLRDIPEGLDTYRKVSHTDLESSGYFSPHMDSSRRLYQEVPRKACSAFHLQTKRSPVWILDSTPPKPDRCREFWDRLR
jgi:hypothetical protein